eukprot:1185262-Prorocentrum_minimum.AAC.3
MQWPILVPFGIEESSSLSESAATMPPWRFSKRAKKGERDDGFLDDGVKKTPLFGGVRCA